MGNARFFKVDVSDEDSIKEGFDAFGRVYGRLDIMVNCAGIVGPTNIKSEDINVKDWDKVQQVNVRGSFLMTKYSLPLMRKNNYGRVLLLASIAGKEGNAGMAAYSCSKAAVIGFVKAAGKEYAETGVTINALAPAVVWTAMVEGLPPEQVKYMTDKIPMKRCGTLDEVASIVKFIVSPEASFNTGCTFDLTGGRAVY
jgi:3-oxoacyl-[acyl-carrier protein] reductase